MFDLNALVSKINLFRQVSKRRFMGQVLKRAETGNDEKESRCVKFFVTFYMPSDPQA